MPIAVGVFRSEMVCECGDGSFCGCGLGSLAVSPIVLFAAAPTLPLLWVGAWRRGRSDMWRGLVAPWKSGEPAQIYQPVGCLECRMTGYSGRVGIYELLLNSLEVRRLIKPQMEIAKLREQAYREGMRPLRISGALKVAQGATSLEEIIKVAPPADEV